MSNLQTSLQELESDLDELGYNSSDEVSFDINQAKCNTQIVNIMKQNDMIIKEQERILSPEFQKQVNRVKKVIEEKSKEGKDCFMASGFKKDLPEDVFIELVKEGFYVEKGNALWDNEFEYFISWQDNILWKRYLNYLTIQDSLGVSAKGVFISIMGIAMFFSIIFFFIQGDKDFNVAMTTRILTLILPSVITAITSFLISFNAFSKRVLKAKKRKPVKMLRAK